MERGIFAGSRLDLWDAAMSGVREFACVRSSRMRPRLHQFLASRGIALTAEARERFLDAVETEYAAALKLLVRRAEGDFKSDTRPERFPKFAQAPRASLSGPSCFGLFEAWIQAEVSRAVAQSIVGARCSSTCRRIFRTAAPARSPQDEARAWKDQFDHGQPLAPRTVSDIWLIG